jgi:hypothetical protein
VPSLPFGVQHVRASSVSLEYLRGVPNSIHSAFAVVPVPRPRNALGPLKHADHGSLPPGCKHNHYRRHSQSEGSGRILVRDDPPLILIRGFGWHRERVCVVLRVSSGFKAFLGPFRLIDRPLKGTVEDPFTNAPEHYMSCDGLSVLSHRCAQCLVVSSVCCSSCAPHLAVYFFSCLQS